MRQSRMPGVWKKINDSRALVLTAVLAGLTGCSWVPDYANPIEWFRDATGASKSDAAEQGQRNAQNLEAGNEEPYPNLATVPPPPDRAMSHVDLEKLQKGLVADRANARYSETQLSEGNSVPPLPGEEPPVAMAPPLTSAPAGTAPAAATTPAAATPPTGGRHPSQPVKGSAQPPAESPLVSPSIGNLPQGQLPRAAPPPPAGMLPAGMTPATGMPATSASGALPPTGAPAGQQLAVVVPTPPLPPPAISPTALAALETPAQPPVTRAPRGTAASAPREAARVEFAGEGGTLSAADDQRLAAVAEQQKQSGGALRVVGYGGAGVGADAAEQELQSFGAALDRANAVAEALMKLGVPAGRITVQTAPRSAEGAASAGQVVVLLER